MEEHPAALYRAVAARLGAFVERCVIEHLGVPEPTAEQQEAAREAARSAERSVLPRLARLLEADLDEQRSTPLALVREAVPFATAALDRLGAPAVARDRFHLERFPDDRYGLVPASLEVLGEDVADLGIAWGAWKAMTHRRRHAP